MKKLLTLSLASLVSLASLSDDQIVAPPADTNTTVDVDAIIGETVKVIQEEGWTAADVADAIRSLRGLYLRENATAEGRKRWHGKVVTTSVDTNTLIRTTVHEDGEVFVDGPKVTTPAQQAQAQLAQLPKRTLTTNGVPTALAAARRRIGDTTVSNVTVRIEAGK